MKIFICLSIGLLFSMTGLAQSKAGGDPTTADQIRDEAAHRFATSPNLTPEQKKKLQAINSRTYESSKIIGAEMVRTKTLLFKTLAGKNYKANEMEQIKQRLIELDRRRLDLMFKALADVQAVIGMGTHDPNFYKDIFDYENSDYQDLARKNPKRE